jgi:anti-anti-sigma factor
MPGTADALRLAMSVDPAGRSEMALDIDVEHDHQSTVVAVRGELDLTTAPELLRALSVAIDSGRRVLVVDLSGVDFCDSSGLSALVRTRNRLDAVGGAVGLVGATPIVQRVLDISGLTEVLGGYPSVEAARAALSS